MNPDTTAPVLKELPVTHQDLSSVLRLVLVPVLKRVRDLESQVEDLQLEVEDLNRYAVRRRDDY